MKDKRLTRALDSSVTKDRSNYKNWLILKRGELVTTGVAVIDA